MLVAVIIAEEYERKVQNTTRREAVVVNANEERVQLLNKERTGERCTQCLPFTRPANSSAARLPLRANFRFTGSDRIRCALAFCNFSLHNELHEKEAGRNILRFRELVVDSNG